MLKHRPLIEIERNDGRQGGRGHRGREDGRIDLQALEGRQRITPIDSFYVDDNPYRSIVIYIYIYIHIVIHSNCISIMYIYFFSH